jgi:hypothetical protein
VTEVQERPRFYEGQYLDAADLTAAVEYGRTQRSRILLGAHRWGIALGMEIMEVPGQGSTLDVVVQPGYGWDGFGRPILVPEPTKLSPSLFATFDAAFVPGNPPPPAQLIEVWVRYDEALRQGPRPGFETCDTSLAFSRVLERFAIEVGPRNEVARRRDEIEIAGRTMDAAEALRAFDPAAPLLVDASVPHQELPGEGESARWLLPIGLVSYQPGNPGTFVARDAAALRRHARSRQYIGAVVGSLEAVGGVVRVHDRTKAYSTFSTSELLSVEGDIRSDGDVRLYGRRLEFIASHTENPRVPFQVLRKDDPGAGTASLNLVIGDKVAGANTLVVGPKTGVDGTGADVHEARLVVTDKGPVGVGVAEPKALLHLREEGLQIGASGTAEDNFHVQSNTDGARALRFYNKDVGTGVPLMSLTSSGRLGIGDTSPTHPLHVRGAKGVRQNALYLSGDSRWSSVTYNAHHNEANNAWEFPDPSKPVTTIEMDGISGFPRFEVFTSPVGNNQAWASRLFVHGHTGDVAVGHNGGSLGVGTSSPTARLDVRGDIVASGDVRLAGLSAMATNTRVRVVWGAVQPDGSISAGDGFTAQKLSGGNGRYQLTFASAFLGQPIVLVSRVYGDITVNAGTAVSAAETAVVDLVTAATAIVATANAAGTRTDGGFTFLAIGPRL